MEGGGMERYKAWFATDDEPHVFAWSQEAAGAEPAAKAFANERLWEGPGEHEEMLERFKSATSVRVRRLSDRQLYEFDFQLEMVPELNCVGGDEVEDSDG